ncbi:MAG: ABC transporter substrate-binding protein [Bdellovibrio sp.]|jgi:branched-chain amino acid transport system substrate-binding protein
MRFFLIAFSIFGLLSFSACTKKSTNEIVIGQFGSMTGSEATFGISTDQGVKLAIEEANAAGGIKGKKIKLVTMDNQGKAEEAAAVVTRLIEQEKVVALLGEVASSRSLAAAPIAQGRKIPMITPSSTNPKVTEVGDYIFRVCFIDPFQGTVMAKFATETLKLKKVAILRDMKSDYSVGLADFFTQKYKELGGNIVAEQTYQSGDVDFKAQLTQIKSKNPDGIYIPGYYTEVGLIARQVRELGIKAILMGGDGWDSSKLSEIGQEAVNGSYFSNHYSSESTDPASVEFMNKFKARYGKNPDGLSAMGYDAALVLIHALKAAPDLSSKAIRDELAKIKDFQAATGKITIDEKRNASKSAVVVQVQGAVNKYVTSINP